MRLSYRIRVNDEWKEIGSYCRDGSRQMGLISSKHTSIDTSLFTRNGKSVTNKASFTLTWNSANGKEYQETIAHFLDAIDSGAIIECEIYDTSASSVLFGGYVDLSSLNITSGKIPESVSLSAKDYIIDLDKKVEDNLVFEDMPVNTIIISLLSHANAKQTVALDSVLDATDKLEYFVVTAEDSFTYREIIDRLLFEWGGYVLYRNPSTGGYEIKKMLTPDAEPSHQVHYLVGNSLKTTTGAYKKKGIVVDYPIVSTMENATLYQADISHSFDENGNVIGHILKPEEFYPENGEIQATYQEFQSNYLDREYQEKRARLQNSNIDLLYVKADSFKLQTNPSEGLDQPAVDLISKPSGTQLYPRKAWMLLKNNTSSDINLLTVDMTGTAVYKERIVSITMPKDAKDPEEYETSYVFSKDKALEFASFYIDWQNLSRTTASWSEHEKESSVGDIVVVKHKDSGIAQKYVVVEQTMKFIDANNVTYSNIAVALSGFNAQKDYVDSVVANKRIPTVIGTSEQYYYSTSKTELIGGTWLDAVDSTNENFMWRRTVSKYSNGNVTVSEAYFAGGEAGEPGASAKMLMIVSDTNIIRYKSNSVPYDNSAANLSLQTSGLTSTDATWYVDGASKGRSSTLKITPSDFDRDWQSSSSSSTARMRCIAQADGKIIMGGVSGALIYSSDNGASWTTVTAFTSGAITGISYNNGRYVAVDSNGIIFSSDNVASGWTQVYDSGKILNAIITDGSVFVAVGEQYPGTEGIICKSSNGIDWETIEGVFPNFYAICYDSKKFHAVGAGGIVWASEDGSTWTQTATIGFDCRGISYDGKYIAGGQGGQIAYSNDGRNWHNGTVTRTSGTSVSHIRAIASAYGVYYSVCYLSNGYGEVWTSNNGRDWTVCYSTDAANTRLWAVGFIGTGILASGDSGKVYYLPLPRSVLIKAESEGVSDTVSIVILQDAIGTSGADGKDGEEGSGIKTSFTRTYTEAQWNDYCLVDSYESWGQTESIRNGCRKGDIFVVSGEASDTGNYHMCLSRCTNDSGDLEGQSISHVVSQKGSTGPQGPQGPAGEDFVNTPGIKISCSHPSYALSGRGICKARQAITFSLIRTDVTDAVTWVILKDGIGVSQKIGEETITVDISVNESCRIVTAQAVAGSYSDELTIYASYDADARAERVYAGYSKAIPSAEILNVTTLDDEVSPLVSGDYALVSVIQEDGKECFTPYIYNGANWTALEGNETNAGEIMFALMNDGLVAPSDTQVSSSIYTAWIKNLVAQNAFAENLIIGNHFRSDNYQEDSTDGMPIAGWKGDTAGDGKLKAVNMVARGLTAYDSKIYGSISHSSLVTVPGSTGTTEKKAASSASLWSIKELFNRLPKHISSSTFRNAFREGSISYNGSTYDRYYVKNWGAASSVPYSKTYSATVSKYGEKDIIANKSLKSIASEAGLTVQDDDMLYVNVHCTGQTTNFSIYVNGTYSGTDRADSLGMLNGWMRPTDTLTVHGSNTNFFNSRDLTCEVTIYHRGWLVHKNSDSPGFITRDNISQNHGYSWTAPKWLVNKVSVTFNVEKTSSGESVYLLVGGKKVASDSGQSVDMHKINFTASVSPGQKVELIPDYRYVEGPEDEETGEWVDSYYSMDNAEGIYNIRCVFYYETNEVATFLYNSSTGNTDKIFFAEESTPAGWSDKSISTSVITVPPINRAKGESFIASAKTMGFEVGKEIMLDSSKSKITINGTAYAIDRLIVNDNAVLYRIKDKLNWGSIVQYSSNGIYQSVSLSAYAIDKIASIETASVIPNADKKHQIGTASQRFSASYINEHHVNGWRISVSNGELSFFYEG